MKSTYSTYSYLFLLLLWQSTQSSTFLNTAHTNVIQSGNAYCSLSQYRQILNHIWTVHDNSTDTQGYVVHDQYQTRKNIGTSASITVVFRGTSSALNWKTDLEMQLIEYPYCEGCKVHRGFYSAAKSLYSQLVPILFYTSSLNPIHVTFTGHSLGAALAELVAGEYTAMKEQPSKTVVNAMGFGKPRVGNKAYASWITDVIQDTGGINARFTHDRDIVPHLPPKTPTFLEDDDKVESESGYWHSCDEWFENSAGDVQQVKDDCDSDVEGGGQYSLKETNVDDHSVYLGHYLECLLE